MRLLRRALDFAFIAWVFLVFFSLPTILFSLYEPEWVEVKSSVKHEKVSAVLSSEEMKARDFFKSRSTLKPKKQKSERLISRGGRRVLTMTATAYCSCSKCCGKADGITASGTKAHWGTVAAPSWLPFGTRLKIEGFNTVFVVEDRGGAIKGNRIDIWMPSHEEALRFGRRRLKVEVLR